MTNLIQLKDMCDSDRFASIEIVHLDRTYEDSAAAISELEYILQLGYEINSYDQDFGFSQTVLFCAASNFNHKVCSWLLAHGAKVDMGTADGFTPLHRAAENDDAATCRILLAAGADPTLKNCEGNTPQDLATGEVLSILRSNTLNTLLPEAKNAERTKRL